MSTMNSPTTLAKSDVAIPRSVFGINNEHITSASAGYLYPIYCAEVLPGDSCRMDLSFLTRMNTPIHPTMGNAYQDIAFFFVPNRIIWDDFKSFFGESPSDPYINPIDYKIPTLKCHYSSPDFPGRDYFSIIPFNSILDFIGLPAGNNFYEFNALPIRAFCLIWNEWWRDQNLQHAIDVPLDSIDRDLSGIGLIDLNNYDSNSLDDTLLWNQDAVEYYEGSNLDFYIQSSALGGVLPPVSKFHDLFTSATLQAQKGDPVPIPINSFNAEWLPVVGRSDNVSEPSTYLRMYNQSNLPPSDSVSLGLNDNGIVTDIPGESNSLGGFYHPSNLWAHNVPVSTDLYSTINDLRYAFAVQKYLELDNFGTRYREILYNHFKVLSPDASMQIPEFLGAKTFRIGMQQVVQTSGTTSDSPQGNLAAYSLTADSTTFFSKSFTEHGWIIGVSCIRCTPEYEQGADRFWRYREKLDIYSPEFSNIGDVPIYLSELWNPDVLYDRDGDILTPFSSYFGFSEAHYQYRQKSNHISGMMRTNRPGSMAYWHYGEYYETQPYLNDEFIRQKRTPIGKTLAGGDNWKYDQFLCNYKFSPVWTRPVPVFTSPWFGGRL